MSFDKSIKPRSLRGAAIHIIIFLSGNFVLCFKFLKSFINERLQLILRIVVDNFISFIIRQVFVYFSLVVSFINDNYSISFISLANYN